MLKLCSVLVVYCSTLYIVVALSDSENRIDVDERNNKTAPEDAIKFYLYHRSNFEVAEELVQGNDELLNNSKYDDTLPTTFLIHGWTHGKNTPWVAEMREVMANLTMWNIIVVDWAQLSRTLYSEARIHSPLVGKKVGELCLYLHTKRGLKISDIHLVGHSMGAQVSAMASALIWNHLHQKVGRISGLDPAAPLYEWPREESMNEVIDQNDAIFVDVIHTNGHYLGMISPCGHVDFYPNGGMHQPGCNFWLCSHMRAVEFWTASIKNPFLFKAYAFSSWNQYVDGQLDGLPYYPMGIAADSSIPKGVYFLETVDEVPYIHTKTTIFTAIPQDAGHRKLIPSGEKYSSTNFLTLWDFKGYFEVSPLFYGWYTNSDTDKNKYRLPLAYFVTGLMVYAYSFFATLRKMAENSRMSKLCEKDDECIFSWKLFTAWDYMIGNSEAAHNRIASILMGIKEALLEEAEKKKEVRNWKITFVRILVNIIILGLFTFSAGTVAFLVNRSVMPDGQTTFWRRNELTIVMTLISIVFPMLFDAMGYFEQYHPRKQLRIQLARIMALNLLNLYSLIFSQFDKIHDMSVEMTNYFINLTSRRKIDQMKKESFEKFLNIPHGQNIHCYHSCHWNITSTRRSLLVGALVLNSSITASNLIFNEVPNNEQIVSSPNFSQKLSFNSLNNFSVDENDNYPNYEDYFSSEDRNYTETENRSFVEGMNFSTQYQEELSPTTLADDIGGSWREKFTDYLSFILSEFQYGQVSSNSNEILFNVELDNVSTISNSNSTFEDHTASSETKTDANEVDTRTTTTVFSTKSDGTVKFETTPLVISTDFNVPYSPLSTESLNEVSEFNEIEQSSTVPNIYKENHKSNEHFNPEQMICKCFCKKEESINMTEVGYLISGMNNSERQKLRTLCWETMFGQELVKLTVMDLIMTFLSTMALDFVRGIFIRIMNSCWCWDLEKDFPKYSDFKVAENILHLVNNQGMIWMGLFFSPGLAIINVIKLFILMYLRAWTVVTCNVPPEVIFRASKSNNFYYALLLMMLFLCVLPVGYAIVWIEPSWYCGPFSGYKRIYHIFTKTITDITPPPFDKALEYIVSPGSIIPLLVLLILFIYYLTSLTSSLREANSELKFQLRRERTEERRKLFRMVDRRKHAGSIGSGDPNNPFYKWKKLLQNLPSTKSQEDPSRLESFDSSQQNSESIKESRGHFPKLMKQDFQKSYISENEIHLHNDDSDTEQVDSLPHDLERKSSSTSNHLRRIIAAFKPDKIKKEMVDIFREEEKEKDIKDYHGNLVRKQSSGNVDTTEYDFKRQESVSSNWSENIPVITISKTESSESILNATEEKLIQHTFETKNSEDPATPFMCGTDKFRPIIRYALKKQSTEVDEESIRHFPKEVMKQRSPTFRTESYWKEDS